MSVFKKSLEWDEDLDWSPATRKAWNQYRKAGMVWQEASRSVRAAMRAHAARLDDHFARGRSEHQLTMVFKEARGQVNVAAELCAHAAELVDDGVQLPAGGGNRERLEARARALRGFKEALHAASGNVPVLHSVVRRLDEVVPGKRDEIFATEAGRTVIAASRENCMQLCPPVEAEWNANFEDYVRCCEQFTAATRRMQTLDADAEREVKTGAVLGAALRAEVVRHMPAPGAGVTSRAWTAKCREIVLRLPDEDVARLLTEMVSDADAMSQTRQEYPSESAAVSELYFAPQVPAMPVAGVTDPVLVSAVDEHRLGKHSSTVAVDEALKWQEAVARDEAEVGW